MRSSNDFHQLIFHQSHPQLASHEIFFIGRPIAFLLSPLLFLLYKSSFFCPFEMSGKKTLTLPGFSSSAGQRAWIPCLNTSFVSENLSKWSFPCFLHLLSLLHPLTTHLLIVRPRKVRKKHLYVDPHTGLRVSSDVSASRYMARCIVGENRCLENSLFTAGLLKLFQARLKEYSL